MAIEDGARKEFVEEIQKKNAKGPHIVQLDDKHHVPQWLTSLLGAKFFFQCKVHAESTKNECHHYCLDCTGDAICLSCLPQHIDHRILQIRRSSYRNVIKVSEISEFMDVSGVQTYVINSAKVVFLDERPQARPVKCAAYACQTCGRPLLESHRYCSIGCKFSRGMSQDRSDTTQRSVTAVSAEGCEGVSSNARSVINSVESDSAFTCRRRRSRRKGIPRRATF